MRIAIFGGSFDPVHREHIRMVKAAVRYLGLDRVFIVPSYIAPHKEQGAFASGEDRLEACRIAFRGIKKAEVSDSEITAGGTSYSYLTCRRFAEKFPDAQLYFLMGADMLEDFFGWKNPEEILSRVTLAVCGRKERIPEEIHRRFSARFGADFEEIPFVGADVSSTALRVELAFGRHPAGIDGKVYRFIRKRGLYDYPAIREAIKLEKPRRRKHSLRVALMACTRARTLGIPEEKALLAAALHDCGKYVPLSSPLLADFDPPLGVPAAVMHQFTGAYLAEHAFGISDRDILNAIRYHTSGREGMSALETLIYLSDLPESERDFAGAAKLREMYWRDPEACLLCSLALQIDYLRQRQVPLYSLTEQAYEWMKQKAKK